MEAARQQQLQQRMATARPSIYGSLYSGRYQPAAAPRATIRPSIRPTAAIRQNYPSLNSRYSYQPAQPARQAAVIINPTIRATVMAPAQPTMASPAQSHYNRLLAAFGEFNKPKTTMTTTTTTLPKITLPVFNFGRFTTTTPLVTKRAEQFNIMENVQLKSAETGAPAAPSASDMLKTFMAQFMARSAGMAASQAAPAAPSIPSA